MKRKNKEGRKVEGGLSCFLRQLQSIDFKEKGRKIGQSISRLQSIGHGRRRPLLKKETTVKNEAAVERGHGRKMPRSNEATTEGGRG